MTTMSDLVPKTPEQAHAIATEITSPDAEGNKAYRKQKYRKNGDGLPTALCIAVGERMGVGKTKARTLLRTSGFVLPHHLRFCLKPKFSEMVRQMQPKRPA